MKIFPLYYKGVSDRITVLRLKRKFNNTTLVNCYAPTEAEEDEYKKEFYLSLHDIIQQIPDYDTKVVLGEIPDYDTKVVLGDFNDQIGKEQWSEDIAGKETIHQTTNKNGTESWTLNKAEEEMLKICERRILRGILGPVEEEEGKRNLMNYEIQETNDGLEWWGHIQRMEENKIPKIINKWDPNLTRKKGRP
ncbi:hypothetical protein QE152_g11389 [Popillia japonica]|uniref:Craniofacial development protein 2-like n=1 Tax=Popillia japonica TaxID=7064 RepID=A0AAW1LSC1_POPJA